MIRSAQDRNYKKRDSSTPTGRFVWLAIYTSSSGRTIQMRAACGVKRCLLILYTHVDRAMMKRKKKERKRGRYFLTDPLPPPCLLQTHLTGIIPEKTAADQWVGRLMALRCWRLASLIEESYGKSLSPPLDIRHIASRDWQSAIKILPGIAEKKEIEPERKFATEDGDGVLVMTISQWRCS